MAWPSNSKDLFVVLCLACFVNERQKRFHILSKTQLGKRASFFFLGGGVGVEGLSQPV